ncbi:MAG: hypothetical protein ABIV25_14190, partial [Paracoccaceae bacterium]
GVGMENFVIKSLKPETWNGFAARVVRHNGLWGRCWGLGFQEKTQSWRVGRWLSRRCNGAQGFGLSSVQGDRRVVRNTGLGTAATFGPRVLTLQLQVAGQD